MHARVTKFLTQSVKQHLPSSAKVQSHLTSSFPDDGNASWYSVCRVPMVEWRLDCEDCRHLTVVGLHDTDPMMLQGSPAAAHTAGGIVAGSPDRVRALWQKARLAVYEAAGLHWVNTSNLSCPWVWLSTLRSTRWIATAQAPTWLLGWDVASLCWYSASRTTQFSLFATVLKVSALHVASVLDSLPWRVCLM